MKDLEFFSDMSLKEFCTFHIGGNARYLFVANSTSGLKKAIKWCQKHKCKFKIIGCGANLLFDDAGFNGAIIVNKSKHIKSFGCFLLASSGTTIAELISFSKQKQLSGLEYFSGIPSSLGGGIVNNLGAWGHEIAKSIVYVKGFFANKPNKIVKLTNKQCKFDYRNSIFKSNNFVITTAKIKLKKASKFEIEHRILETIKKKHASQPMDKFSAGSVFKRSQIIPAKLIEEAGLKGLIVGNAQISQKHSGFIVNIGNASARDVKNLVEIIKLEIKTKYDVNLDLEIEYVSY